MLLYALLVNYKVSFPLFLYLQDDYDDSEPVKMSDNTNIDEMSEMSYKVDLEIINTSRNKRKIEEVHNQVSKVISDLEDWVEKNFNSKTPTEEMF